jgi:hypothetical protein
VPNDARGLVDQEITQSTSPDEALFPVVENPAAYIVHGMRKIKKDQAG